MLISVMFNINTLYGTGVLKLHYLCFFLRKQYPRENFGLTNTHEQIFQTHEMLTSKNFRPTKCSREKNLDPQNTHDKKFWTHEIPTKVRWLDGTKTTRPTIAREQGNLSHSYISQGTVACILTFSFSCKTIVYTKKVIPYFFYDAVSFVFFNWDSLHARLNSHYEA